MAGFCIVLLMMGFFVPILIVVLLFLLVYLMLILFNYIMEGFALYRMCRNSNYAHPITAWIPYYNRIILGDFADNKKMGNILFISKLVSLLLQFVVYFILKANGNDVSAVKYINYIVLFLSFGGYILDIILVHKIMKKAIPKAADVLTVINIFTFGISKAIILFVLRNNEKLVKQVNLNG